MPLTANIKDSQHRNTKYYNSLTFLQKSLIEFIIFECPCDVEHIVFDFDEYLPKRELMFKMASPKRTVQFRMRYSRFEGMANSDIRFMLLERWNTAEKYFYVTNQQPNGAIFLG